MLTFATEKLSTGANGQKEDADSFFFPHSLIGRVMVAACNCEGNREPGKVRVILFRTLFKRNYVQIVHR